MQQVRSKQVCQQHQILQKKDIKIKHETTTDEVYTFVLPYYTHMTEYISILTLLSQSFINIQYTYDQNKYFP